MELRVILFATTLAVGCTVSTKGGGDEPDLPPLPGASATGSGHVQDRGGSTSSSSGTGWFGGGSGGTGSEGGGSIPGGGDPCAQVIAITENQCGFPVDSDSASDCGPEDYDTAQCIIDYPGEWCSFLNDVGDDPPDGPLFDCLANSGGITVEPDPQPDPREPDPVEFNNVVNNDFTLCDQATIITEDYCGLDVGGESPECDIENEYLSECVVTFPDAYCEFLDDPTIENDFTDCSDAF